MRAIDFIVSVCPYPASVERVGTVAKKSEIRRWIKQGWILFNGEPMGVDEDLNFPLISVVAHPNNARRITIL